jgi:GNAT superfamily N-acetyltransferase
MIRIANKDDVPRLVELGLEFLSNHFIPGGYNRESLEASFHEWFADPEHPARLLVYVDDRGLILGSLGYVAAPMYWNHDVLGSKELFWWVSREARGAGVGSALLEAYGKDLDERGIQVGFMTTLDDSTAAAHRILRRCGWVQAEVNFLRLR